MKKQFRIIIAGGRDFYDYQTLKKKCKSILSNKVSDGYEIVIVSGKAPGADLLGEQFAKEMGYQIDSYPAKWDDLSAKPCSVKVRPNGTKYNALAGHNRNGEMANNADALIAFHNGRSTGTANMIKQATEKGLLVRVINVFY